MAFAAVGTFIQSQSATMAVNPSSLSNFFLVEVIWVGQTQGTLTVTGGNCTWAQLGTLLTAANSDYVAEVFLGTPTGTGSASATFSWVSGTPADIGTVGQQFSSSAPPFSLDGSQGNLDVSDTGAGTGTYPSLTPAGAGELYFGYCGWIGNAGDGSTSGYTYDIDANSDGLCFNPACTSAAQAPTWTVATDGAFIGIAVLMKETGASVSSGPPLAPGPPSRVAVTGGRAGRQGAQHSR